MENAESDADILALLTGAVTMLPGTEPNRDAAAKVEEYLEMQDRKHLPNFHGGCSEKIPGDSLWMA